jgi:phage gp46-like protein
MADFSVTMTASGGDWFVEGSDIALTSAIYQQIILALFGGNVEASTKGEEAPAGTKREDYWGNAFTSGQSEIQFNSEYERRVMNSAISTASLQGINDAARADLTYLEDLGVAQIESIESFLVDTDKIRTEIGIQEPGESTAQAFAIIWDATKTEFIITDI